VLIASTFAEGCTRQLVSRVSADYHSTVGCNMKTIYNVTRHAARPLVAKLRRSQPEAMPVINEDDTIYDPAPPHEQVPWWMWGGGLLLSIIMTCVVLGVLVSSRR
jgi:hypothetical protein